MYRRRQRTSVEEAEEARTRVWQRFRVRGQPMSEIGRPSLATYPVLLQWAIIIAPLLALATWLLTNAGVSGPVALLIVGAAVAALAALVLFWRRARGRLP